MMHPAQQAALVEMRQAGLRSLAGSPAEPTSPAATPDHRRGNAGDPAAPSRWRRRSSAEVQG